MRNTYHILVENLKGKDHSQYLGVDGRKECSLGKMVGNVWDGFLWLRIVPSGGILWFSYFAEHDFRVIYEVTSYGTAPSHPFSPRFNMEGSNIDMLRD
jgi:hypothetical protein